MIFTTRIDLPFARDPSTRFLPWIIAFLSFIATLAFSGFLVLFGQTDEWSEALDASVTVELRLSESETTQELDQRVADVVAMLGARNDVLSVTALPQEQLRDYLEPWLGTAVDAADLPLPRLIDVELDGASQDVIAALNAALVPYNGRADDHATWRRNLTAFLLTMQVVAIAIVAIVIVASIVMVAFAIRGSLTVHTPALELLRLIGARDAYVVRQFQTVVAGIAVRGAVGGSAAALVLVAVMVVVGSALQATEGGVGAILDQGKALLPTLAIAPGLVLVAILSARRTVLNVLKRMV